MSFYISYVSNIKDRQIDNIFYYKEPFLFRYHKEKESLALDLKKENFIKELLNYIDLYEIGDFELVIPSEDVISLEKIIKTISKYLLKKDLSIGLLTRNKNYQKEYVDILDKYSITYTNFPIEKILKKVSNRVKAKPRPRNNDTLVCEAPRRIETSSIDRPLGAPTRSDLFLEKPFHEKLIDCLNESNKSNVEVYRAGGITRQVFSNIISNKNLIPKKDTIICLIIGMELNYIDAIDLLHSAGYTLSKSIVFDVVINKYLKKGIYDLLKINDELEERQCPLLGWKPRD